MGNLIVGIILIGLFSGIIYYLINSVRTRGTVCTSCTACPIVEKCDKDTIKADMLKHYRNQT